MHVAIFHQLFSTREGSTVTRSYTFARRLVARGHRVTVVCARSVSGCSGLDGPFVDGRRTGIIDGIGIIELAGAYSNHQGVWARTREFLAYARATVCLALTLDYDVIFCKSAPLTAGIPGIVATVLRGKPYVFEAGDLWPAVPKAMGLKNPILLAGMGVLERANYRAARLCIGVAPGIIRGFLARGVPENRTVLVPNGCDLDLFQPNDDVPRPEIPGVRPEDFVAVYAGAHGRANGLDVAVEAARRLDRDEGNRVRVVLIGDGALKPQLRKQAEGVRSIVFVDPMPKTRLADMMRRADCGIVIFAPIPIIYDCTSPNKFYDYIALGLPVVVAYPGWIAEIIAAHGCGRLSAAGDPVGLAMALRAIAADPTAAKAMGARARALALREFDRNQLADFAIDRVEALVTVTETQLSPAGQS